MEKERELPMRGIFDVTVVVDILDRKGRLVRKGDEQYSHCMLMQFLEMIYTGMRNSQYAVTAQDGTEDIWSIPPNMRADGNAGESYRGIIVGTGDAVVVNEDYTMAAMIAHGNGAGQLMYGTMDFIAPAIVGNNVEMTSYRTLTNNSGATVTIKEIGIGVYANALANNWLISRDVLTAAYDILDTEAAVARYKYKTTC